MSIIRLIWIATSLAVLLTAGLPGAAQANVAQPPVRMVFEFFDEAAQPVAPESLQLAGCQDQVCQNPVVLFQKGVCKAPGCLTPPVKVPLPVCDANMCRVEAFEFRYPYYQLILLPPASETGQEARSGIFQQKRIEPGSVRGLHVVITPSGLDFSEDEDLAAQIPGGTSGYCSPSPPIATIGFVITQVVELAAALLLLLLLGIRLRLIGGVLAAISLINFATFPVVWFTFPALGPGPTTEAQAAALFTLLAALLYAGLLVRLQPAFHPARRSMVVGLLAVALPMVTVLIFGAASAASAAADALGAAEAAGAGLPYRVTMPASEVFAYSAEALLIFLLCRPVLSARQAVLLSVLANSASLALGLMVL
jgi:hypothetical protein